MILLLFSNVIVVVEELLKAGANPNITDAEVTGFTQVHICALNLCSIETKNITLLLLWLVLLRNRINTRFLSFTIKKSIQQHVAQRLQT